MFSNVLWMSKIKLETLVCQNQYFAEPSQPLVSAALRQCSYVYAWTVKYWGMNIEHDQNAKKSYFFIHIALSTNLVLKSAPRLTFFNKPWMYACLKPRPNVSPKIQELLAQLILSDMVTTHTGLLTNVCSFIAMRKVPCVTFMVIPWWIGAGRVIKEKGGILLTTWRVPEWNISPHSCIHHCCGSSKNVDQRKWGANKKTGVAGGDGVVS